MNLDQEWERLRELRKQATQLEKEKRKIQKEILEHFGRKSKLILANGHFLRRSKVTVPEHTVPEYTYQKLVEKDK